MALKVAERLGLREIKPYESALVRLNLERCKKNRCKGCPVSQFCKEKIKNKCGLHTFKFEYY